MEGERVRGGQGVGWRLQGGEELGQHAHLFPEATLKCA